ncbi:MAG: hypothetical protein M1835_007831 [Candelina submexicana]|nr:MAG: hypothetical protein M1835_007831 [Candelina submexicana]
MVQIDDIDSPERVEQLEKIDLLRELGVGEEINLPQLVVVGDQSSGKSSLLEGLTGLPFPVASDLCTRSATQVGFRRSKSQHEAITVSIIPSAASDDEHKKKLSQFHRSMAEFTADTFLQVLEEAAACMGLPVIGDKNKTANRRFSNDVLKIEISGPKQHQLSFVDVPGLFHSPTEHQTAEDLINVQHLIESYVGDRRTIIMAVMDARNNLANQGVFRIAKAADKEGLRTVGIMTKLDAVQEGDEPLAIKIAQNQAEKLNHGWYCVRNRKPEELKAGMSIEERHAKEKVFFETAPWSVLDKKRVGISSLKASLGRLLSNHVASEFPEIRRETETCYLRCRDKLDQLGAPRQTAHEQMQYILKLAGLYQRKVEDSLNGRYSEEGLHPSKLRMHIRNANESFAKDMLRNGCTIPFSYSDKPMTDDKGSEAWEDEAEDNESDTSSVPNSKPENIYTTIKELYSTSGGTELPGHVNPMVLEALFARQTTKWPYLADIHVTKVINIIWKCIDFLWQDMCLNETVRKRIRERIDPEIEESMEAAKKELQRILQDERSGPLITDNHYYADNLAKARAERVVAGLKKMGFQDGKTCVMNFKSITSIAHLSNEASAIHDIHDTLKAYYKVALKRFIDNVSLQVIERNLLGPAGPVNVFTPEYVGKLDTSELASIAAEDFETSNTRSELAFTISQLEKARKVCSGKSLGG